MSSPSKPEGAGPADEGVYRLSQESPLAPEGIQPPPPMKRYVTKRGGRERASVGGTLIGFNALVFVTSVCVMTLELTASRLIGKHVGSSLYTWTSVIGVVLSGITLGNWLGGWLADRFDRARALGWVYLLGSISCASVLWLDQLMANFPRPDTISWPAWVVTVVSAMFMAPSLALGTVSPLVASMALDRSRNTGSTVGNVYAWGALGSIVGTFLTGFYLIDVWGTRSIIGMTAGTLAVLAVLVVGARKVFRIGVVAGWLQLLGWTMLFANSNSDAMAEMGQSFGRLYARTQPQRNPDGIRDEWSRFGYRLGDKLHELGLMLRLRDDQLHQYHDESNYSDITVYDSRMSGRDVKVLKLDKLIHSYYDPAEPTALHYEYEKIYAAVTKQVVWTSAHEPITLSTEGLSGVDYDQLNFPAGVTLSDDRKSLSIEHPTKDLFEQLLALAPESDYWKAIDQLLYESSKPGWGGFSSVSLAKLPDGIIIPDDVDEFMRHDETLGLLVVYERLSKSERDKLIALTPSGAWYQRIQKLRGSLYENTACFYGGGGFVFPRWFLEQFPGSQRIDVAELDPGVYQAVKSQLGLTAEMEQRIHTTIGDARNFVDDRLRQNQARRSRQETPIVYDFIYADAFNDFSIPWHLTTQEFLQKTHDLLSEQGVFQANIIDIYPRIEYPGTAIGTAETEYFGRLPDGVISSPLKRETFVPAAKSYAPLEIAEVVSNRYRLRVARMLTSGDETRLTNVSWPERKSKILDLNQNSPPQIEPGTESDNWRKAIEKLKNASQKKLEYGGKIPEALKIADGALEKWVSGAAPFQFVEANRFDGERYNLGFRGLITSREAQQLIELDQSNAAWVKAVEASAAKSRRNAGGRFMGRYVATAAKVFPNVYLFSTSNSQPDASRDTFVMVCSRQPLDLLSLDNTGDWKSGPFASLETPSGQKDPVYGGQMRSVIALSEGQLLTDDHAPVDNLLAPIFDTHD